MNSMRAREQVSWVSVGYCLNLRSEGKLAERCKAAEVMLVPTQSSVVADVSSKNDVHWRIQWPGPWSSVDKSTKWTIQ